MSLNPVAVASGTAGSSMRTIIMCSICRATTSEPIFCSSLAIQQSCSVLRCSSSSPAIIDPCTIRLLSPLKALFSYITSCEVRKFDLHFLLSSSLFGSPVSIAAHTSDVISCLLEMQLESGTWRELVKVAVPQVYRQGEI
jgi:hypothetical protein